MMPARHQGLLRLFIACALRCWRCNPAAADWQLEKVVELSRHGIRPPTAGNRKPSRPPPDDRGPSGPPMTGAHRPWLCRRGQQGRAEGQHRQLGLLQAGCPTAESIRARQPAAADASDRPALVDGAFPAAASLSIMSAGMPILFQTDKFAATQPTRPPAGGGEREGRDLAQRRQALAPTIQLLKQAVCQADKPCPIFDTRGRSSRAKVEDHHSGLSVMANMVETLRLGWSENLPLSQLAWARSRRRSPPCCRC